MSNATQEFSYFVKAEAGDSARNPAVALLDGAQGGMVANAWTSPTAVTWTVVEQRLAMYGYTDQQIQAIWLKQADGSPRTTFETYAHGLQAELGQITQIAAQRYPNLRQVFVSPRTYGGYSLDGPNPEPYAYQTGFADKFFIAQSVANPTARPWVGWGPYLWTDGVVGRADGLKWYCQDTVDGTHPSLSGRAKVDTLMHSMFTGSDFTPWFGSGSSVSPPSPSAMPSPPPQSPRPRGAAASPVTGQSTAQPGSHQAPGGSTVSTPAAGALLSPPAGMIRSAFSMASRDWPLTIGVILVVIAACIGAIGSAISWQRRRAKRKPVKRPPSLSGANGAHSETPPSVDASAPPVLAGSRSGNDPSKPRTP